MARKSRKNIPEAVPVHNDLFINVALYIRLSVEDGKKRSNSIENQQLIIDDYISDKPEFKVYDTYIDNGLTGATFDRPSFQRMLADIEAGHINCVIVKDLSRLGRNAIDTGYYIEQYFPKNKVRFIAVTDNFDTANPSRSSGIMLPLKNMINEAYAIDIGRKIRAQAHQDMLDGNFIGARAPFGYRKDPDNCHKLLIDEATAPIVRQIFEWSAAGIGANVIAIKLNELNTVTSSGYKQSTTEQDKRYRRSTYWTSFSVLHILDNPVYTGDMVQGKSISIERHKQIAANPDDYIIVRDTHEPIVSRELFEKAKQFREAVRDEYKQKSVNPYSENIFKGKIFCSHCGKPLHRTRNARRTKADIYRFRCIANDRIRKGACVGVTLSENEVTEAVCAGIKDIIGKLAISSAECSTFKRQKEQLTKSISEYQSELEKVLSFVRSLYENFVEGIISNDEYISFKSDYSEKAANLKEKITTAKRELSQIEDTLQKRELVAKSTKAFMKDGKLTAELISLFVKRIEVTHDKEINIEYNDEMVLGKEAV
ncbi:MAG: recombinase family protein [Ruminiclostridium sp.]